MLNGPSFYEGQRDERDQELAADGWVRRFIGAPPRLEEVEELYTSLNLEVLLDRLSPDELADVCSGCGLALEFYRVVYTRTLR